MIDIFSIFNLEIEIYFQDKYQKPSQNLGFFLKRIIFWN